MTTDAAIRCRRYADILRASGNSERTIDNYVYSLKGYATSIQRVFRLARNTLVCTTS